VKILTAAAEDRTQDAADDAAADLAAHGSNMMLPTIAGIQQIMPTANDQL
jgi:hypothetical protein